MQNNIKNTLFKLTFIRLNFRMPPFARNPRVSKFALLHTD
ncbi:hypothetical protein GW13_PRO3613 [Salmonella enterica subsp. enterica serovar Cerro]|nr:hypothetical protein GW13_PRO3613 [Salmonella enterica subsp. enterica serovar Cerro]KZG09803.1 carbamoyl phosphate synthase small subunit [Salmonella enterica subsp. enterica serovar Tennessee]KZG17664.1 carbamoyl phosphate synthase small subunit [Salmonella enterica subsp. enterica serovar Tennessee]OFB16253.1 carbamoyl phosphate synthase small subunit [Salmonella enterica subsp. enterica serovar Typhimurium]